MKLNNCANRKTIANLCYFFFTFYPNWSFFRTKCPLPLFWLDIGWQLFFEKSCSVLYPGKNIKAAHLNRVKSAKEKVNDDEFLDRMDEDSGICSHGEKEKREWSRVEDWEVTNYAVAPGEPKLARQDSWAHAEEQRVGIGLSTHSYSTSRKPTKKKPACEDKPL